MLQELAIARDQLDPAKCHDNIMKIYGAVVWEDGIIEVICEDCGTMSFGQVIEHRQPLATAKPLAREKEVALMSLQAARALHHFHTVHHAIVCDVKDGNMMADPNTGHAKAIDHSVTSMEALENGSEAFWVTPGFTTAEVAVQVIASNVYGREVCARDPHSVAAEILSQHPHMYDLLARYCDIPSMGFALSPASDVGSLGIMTYRAVNPAAVAEEDAIAAAFKAAHPLVLDLGQSADKGLADAVAEHLVSLERKADLSSVLCPDFKAAVAACLEADPKLRPSLPGYIAYMERAVEWYDAVEAAAAAAVAADQEAGEAAAAAKLATAEAADQEAGEAAAAAKLATAVAAERKAWEAAAAAKLAAAVAVEQKAWEAAAAAKLATAVAAEREAWAVAAAAKLATAVAAERQAWEAAAAAKLATAVAAEQEAGEAELARLQAALAETQAQLLDMQTAAKANLQVGGAQASAAAKGWAAGMDGQLSEPATPTQGGDDACSYHSSTSSRGDLTGDSPDYQSGSTAAPVLGVSLPDACKFSGTICSSSSSESKGLAALSEAVQDLPWVYYSSTAVGRIKGHTELSADNLKAQLAVRGTSTKAAAAAETAHGVGGHKAGRSRFVSKLLELAGFMKW